jgi:hypothetical protein
MRKAVKPCALANPDVPLAPEVGEQMNLPRAIWSHDVLAGFVSRPASSQLTRRSSDTAARFTWTKRTLLQAPPCKDFIDFSRELSVAVRVTKENSRLNLGCPQTENST